MSQAGRVEQADSVTVRVPITIRKRGGRKRVLSPAGIEERSSFANRCADNATVRAIARAFRWREMLESGKYQTIREIADDEKINEAYVSRVLRLTLLSPRIVDAIVDGRPTPPPELQDLLGKFALDWQKQSFVDL